jgi:hypothetical protein
MELELLQIQAEKKKLLGEKAMLETEIKKLENRELEIKGQLWKKKMGMVK